MAARTQADTTGAVLRVRPRYPDGTGVPGRWPKFMGQGSIMGAVNNRREWVLGVALAVGALAPVWAPTAAAAAFTAGQAVEVREGDSWSAASVVRREGRKYLIHYAGSDATTDEWVGPDRIRTPGGTAAPAAATPAATPATPPVTPPPAPVAPADADDPPAAPARPAHARPRRHGGDMFPMPDEVMPQTEADRSAVEATVTADPPAAWAAAPDPAAKPAAVRSFALHAPTGGGDGDDGDDGRMSLQQLLPCGDGGAVVGFSSFGEKGRRVERVGTVAAAARATLPAQSLPLSASPSGAVLVCRCKAFGFGNNGRVDAYTLSPGAAAAVPLVSFTPYPGDGTRDGTRDKPEDVRFAAALSDTRVVTCDLKGRLVAWDVSAASVKGVWRADVGEMHFGGDETRDVVVSPGGKWLAAAGKGGITFVEAATGRVLGVIDTAGTGTAYDLACSPTGRTVMARVGDGGVLASFDVATGKARRSVAVSAVGALACPDDDFALFGGRTLVDANTGAAVPEYKPGTDGFGGVLAETGPGVTLLASGTTVSAAHVPGRAARDAATAAAATALALQPGTPVAVDVQVDLSDADRAAVDAAVRRKLTDDGFVIVPSADTTVVCRTEAGQPHEHVYGRSRFGMPVFAGTNGQSMILTDKVTRITIQQKGRTVWERKLVSGPASSFPLKDGQSIEDAAKATMQYSPRFLIGVSIPAYIAKPQ